MQVVLIVIVDDVVGMMAVPVLIVPVMMTMNMIMTMVM